jgi:hypothetical protein
MIFCGGATQYGKPLVRDGGAALPWTNYALDTFFGHRLSELTTCGAEELPVFSQYLPAFLLSSVFQVGYKPDVRAYAFNFIRRIEQAALEYSDGRAFLERYLQNPNEAISQYYHALSHFEQCVALIIQATKFLERLGPEKLFRQGSNPDLERLNRVYNASKHMEGQIAEGRVPTSAIAAVWITNDGVECHDAKIAFKEMHELIVQEHEVARQIVEELPKRVQSSG